MSLNLKVKVIDNTTSTRSGIAKASGKPYTIRTQDNVFVEMGGEVRRMPFTLNENESPHAPGYYTMDIENHLTLNRFNALEIRPFVEYQLVPISQKSVVDDAGLSSISLNKTKEMKFG